MLAAAAARAASSNSSKQAVKKLFSGTPWLKTGIEVAQNNPRANAHHLQEFFVPFRAV